MARLYTYANLHRGIVYDLGREITIDHGYPLDYPFLLYDGSDKQTNRFRMGKEIDAMLARLSEETEDSFDYIAIIGDDEVVPFYRRSDPLGQEIGYGDKAGTGCAARVDSGGNFILTDVPYSMRADDDPETVPNPVPEVALGRIFADHPDQLITMIDAYDTPLRFVPGQARAALFPIIYDGIAWPWFIEHLFIPILEQRGLKTGNIQAVPPYAAGKFYYWDPYLFDWRPVTVTHAISDTTLTVIYSHADHTSNQTPLGVGCDMERALCDEHYDPMPLADQHVFVNAGCHGGYSVAHHSAAAKFDDYEPAIVSSLMEKHVVYLGNTVYGRGVNYANEWDDYLWTGFVNQLFNAGTPTVGAAWLRAWPGYWHPLSAASPSAPTQAYGKAFYGLPTQPIKHTSVTAAVSAVDGAAVAGTASIRRLSLPIDIAEFEIVETGDGALVRPGNGGGVLGVLDKPLVPQVIQRFSLPLNTTWVTITENLAARTTEDLGPIPLAVGTTGLRCVDAEPASRSVAATLEEPFPAKSWSAEFSYLPDALEVVLRVIPAQVAPDGALTVFHHMQFDLDVVLPALSPEITALSVNNGQPVQAGQGKVAAQITVSSDRQLPLEVSCEVWEPGGALIDSAISPITLDSGSHQVNIDLDGAGWVPGPKLVTMSIADGETGLVYDARSQQVMVNGVQVALKVDQPGVAPGQTLSLRVEARNESGALVAGLSEETTLRVDDIPVNVDVTEDRTGVYVADLPTTAIASGIHIVEVQVTYAQGFMASDIAQFGVGSQWVQQLFVPALTKGG